MLGENNIKYPNHFISYIDASNKNNIIDEQRISNYPYYILIDKNRRIIYRGIGKEALKEITISKGNDSH